MVSEYIIKEKIEVNLFKKLHSKNKWVVLDALKFVCSCVEIHECYVKFLN